MKNRIHFLAIAAALFIAMLFIISLNYYRIVYAIDSAHQYLISKRAAMPSDSSLDIRFPEKTRGTRKKTYAGLPEGFIHCAPFLVYNAVRDTTVESIAMDIIDRTSYYRLAPFKTAIKNLNSLRDSFIGRGQSILIPGTLPVFTSDMKNYIRPPLMEARGIYLTGLTAGNPGFPQKAPYLKQIGINSVVFDVKDVGGTVNYRSSLPMVKKYNLSDKCPIDNVDLFIKSMKSQGIYTIARIAVFRDHALIEKAPQLAIKSKRSGGVWNRGSKEIWCDPTSRIVQDYNIDLALEIASKGADEIQFDYIRFPTTGDLNDASFAYDYGKMEKEQAISDFLARAFRKISAANARLSIDIFGVVAWGKNVDIQKTGQRIELLSQNCDYISPMLYPSHFENDFDGYANPADHPYYFINEGNRKVMERLANKKVVIRPWLQAFQWRVTSYSPQYIIKQIEGSRDSGASGYLFWNASNDYDKVFAAMEKIYGKKGKGNNTD